MKERKKIKNRLIVSILTCMMLMSLAVTSVVVFNNKSDADVYSEHNKATVVATVGNQEESDVDNCDTEDDVYRDVELSEEDKELFSDISPEDASNEEQLEEAEAEAEEVDPQEEECNFVNPKIVKFMQSSIKNQTGEYTVLGNAQALKEGTLKPTDLALIRLWKDDKGNIWTLDHRRLAAFRLAGLESVPFQWATEEEVANQMWKMTTKTNGETIRLKLGKGQSMIVE